jgi:hypothetical protein
LKVNVYNPFEMQGRPRGEEAELVKWWDALERILGHDKKHYKHAHTFVLMARDCQHPDAVWLASLFPQVRISLQCMAATMAAQGDDPRALLIWAPFGGAGGEAAVLRSAQMGYAVAQGQMAHTCSNEHERFQWASKAAAQGDRVGIFELGECFRKGRGCTRDLVRAAECIAEAARLGHDKALYRHGEAGFGAERWQRFVWWSRGNARGARGTARSLDKALQKHLPQCATSAASCRIVFEVGRECSALLARLFEGTRPSYELRWETPRVLEAIKLYQSWSSQAEKAVRCWLMVSRQLGLIRDMRFLIAKRVWSERWAWAVPPAAVGVAESESK